MAVTKRKPAAKSRRRKSTAEPKQIIKRKKQTARKATGVAREKAAAAREKAAKQKLAKDSRDKDRAERMKARGKSIKEIAEALSTPPARVRKLLREASVNPKDKIVGTDAEVAKQIVKLRDAGDSWPSIRVRTGMSGAKIRSLYAEAGGKAGPGRAKKAATAKPTRKSGAARKAAASKAKPKAAARSKRSAPKAKAADDLWLRVQAFEEGAYSWNSEGSKMNLVDAYEKVAGEQRERLVNDRCHDETERYVASSFIRMDLS